MIKIVDPTIAKDRYTNRKNLKEKIRYEDWIEFIESRKHYFIWMEDTKGGKHTLSSLCEIPESFRKGIISSHNKKRAFAEFNKKKGYYELYIDFNKKFGTVSTTFQKKITKKHIKLLLEMANYLDAYLLNNGTEIIDESYLDNNIK